VEQSQLRGGAPESCVRCPGARLYLLDDDDTIKAEHVVFFVTPDYDQAPGER
jgi:hypothetical protein